MHGARLQTRQAQFAKPAANRALVNLDRPAAGHFGLQIHTPPAYDFVHGGIGALDHQIAQFRLLRRAQERLSARALARLQPVKAVRVIAMHPVA